MRILNWYLFLEKFVGEKAISNIQRYIEGMNYTMHDKMFGVVVEKCWLIDRINNTEIEVNNNRYSFLFSNKMKIHENIYLIFDTFRSN